MKLNERLSVLYVEDNDDSGLMLTVLLGFSDIDVHWVRSVKEALQSAQERRFDLFLLDSTFPDESGYDLCRQLRKFFPQIPIVFYSGEARASDRQKGLVSGANAYLVKPEIDMIVPTIYQIVETKPIYGQQLAELSPIML